MKLLLDTHVFIWTLVNPEKISRKALEKINKSTCYVSYVSLWEISLKYSLNKLKLDNITIDDICSSIEPSGLSTLGLSKDELCTFNQLNMWHKDPFDRMLIWQAIKNGLILISKDSEMKKYEADGLRLLW